MKPIGLRLSPSMDGSSPPAERRFALFDYGFRPFFLLTGLYAICAVAVWLWVLQSGAWPDGRLQPQHWHAHEMLFGFVAAAIAGFLLTAVPNWTGRRGFSGRPLMILVGLWFTGRLAMALAISLAGTLPALVVAAIDLAFFPALAAILAPSLIKARRFHNLPFLLILALLFTANLLFHLEWLGWAGVGIDAAVPLAVDTVLLVIVVVGGRIVPSFTLNALRKIGTPVTIPPRPWLDGAAIGSVALVLVVDLAAPGTPLAGAAALAAALLHAVRLGRWHGPKTIGEPILWVLHLGYAWIVIGLALKAAWLLAGAEFAALWLHALTIGGFATMILAVTTRASLGHTGRALVAPRPIVLSYLLITLAAAIRVFGPTIGIDYLAGMAAAGLLWVGAFLLFVIVYAPILVRPRPDGQPG
jgi:uncharacterized protein involved in response to NO